MLLKTRSRSMFWPKSHKSKNEKDYLHAVALLPCCICGHWPVEVHHQRTGIGLGQRASHFNTLPLCLNHHRGKEGIHTLGRKAWEKHIGTTELQLVRKMQEKMKIMHNFDILKS